MFMLAASTIGQKLREFIQANYLYGREYRLKDDDSLAAEGIIDSTGVLQLVTFLEETYEITVEDEELTPENLDSVSSIAAYICRKRSVVPD
jgi:acyl carrier protein